MILVSSCRIWPDDVTNTKRVNEGLALCHHHHHVAPPARISLTLSRHFSLSFIASGRSSGLHPVSSHSCCMYVRAGRPTLAHPYVGVHRSTSLMSSSLLLQQCPACLVRRTCINSTKRRWVSLISLFYGGGHKKSICAYMRTTETL